MAEIVSKKSPRPSSTLLWPTVALVALLAVNIVMNPSFAHIAIRDGHLYGSLVDILNQGARGMLLAFGMTLVIATGGVDLSVGSIMAVSGSIAAVLLTQHDSSLAVAVIAAVAAGSLIGGANAIMVAGLRVQPIVATLISMVVARGVAQLVCDGQVILIQRSSFEFLGNGFILTLPFAAVFVLILYGVAHVALRRTAYGLFIEAVGDNEKASRFAGLATSRIKGAVYLLNGACAGIAGVLAAANIRAADAYRVGENMELDAIFAAVVGGTALTGGRFSIAGALIGAVLLQTLTTTLYNLGVAPAVSPVPKAAAILIVCLLQSAEARRWALGWVRRPA